MTRRTNFTNRRPSNSESPQTPNYANLVLQNPLQVAAQPQPTFVNTFRQNLEIDPLDPDQTIATPEEVPSNAKTAAQVLLAGFSGQEMSQIDFYAEEPSEVQIVEAKQRARTATDLVMCRKQSKHNNPSAQPMLAFDRVLADLETKLLQQYRLLQGILTQIVKRDWLATLKFNLCTCISIYETIYKVNMMRAQMDTTEQGNLLKTQPSPIIHPWYNSQMLGQLSELSQIEGAHPASVDTLLTRIVGFTGELDHELKKQTAQQVIDMIRSKPQIIPPEWAQDLVRKPTPETQLTAIITTSIPLPKLWIANAIPDLTNSVPSYPITESIFTNDEPTVNNKRIRLQRNDNARDQQGTIQPNQQTEQAVIQTVERPRRSTTSIRSVNNMLIPPIPAYPEQQPARIPLFSYITERNQQQRQSQRSISPTHKRADESEEDDFLDEIIPRITILHLSPHKSDIESAQ
ncbi:MAG: hypothetical protein EZS28_011245 [Streblomastix strix]|uniref:Uncharacterized protein n=1 Tax=Streblomastix strix TaxID=222440 RepID=A0A5J4WE52_9EUKA|nr:MAG: hypothetical protein EZS28_011245 [Streblomastix strix]